MEIRSIFTKWGFILLFVVYSILWVNASEADKPKVRKIGKDQDDDPLEPDELPEHLRPQPNIDLSKVDLSNPDNILKVSKKGKSTMMFVDVNPELTQSEADNILSIWQTSLQNNHIIAERFPIDQKRAIFMFRDGSQVVDAKNFLIEQPECSYVTLEGQNYIGKYASTVSNVS
ncbi:PREDICTED: LDLR chaperone boca isoform X2 [Ceratosolen solmsi marchali]|uniref:LDLR chaperone boca isoform X2 n=1 Tax=Ceratosolen solmsi marchali TaxID=326594 RepID=A0AAJ6YQ57_9HYME|nr:PREDICTED: LDLR chaperone boca isoform X2 [Ceratosolen solmsi marchali]